MPERPTPISKELEGQLFRQLNRNFEALDKMTERPLWTDMDELGFQMGDMHGEAFVDLAEDKTIKGKVDSGHHDGRHANVKREQEAQEQLKQAQKDLVNSPAQK